MGLVRQLPSLYLRGSLANITMAGLDEEQKNHIQNVFETVIKHEELARHRSRVMKELGITIRADYADDRAAAEQEFDIAVWRGVVSIFYHHKYSFKCTHCQAVASTTQRGKPKPIDRLEVPCPACGMAEIDNPGCSEYKTGDIVCYADVQKRFAAVSFNTPTYKSCVRAIAGAKKHNNPDEIINCPKQLRRFFGEFIWNYFRQQIKENKRKEHNKKPIKITGPADQIIVEMIVSLCSRLNIDYNRNHKIELMNGKYTIGLIGLLTSPEFSIELASIRAQYAEPNGVMINITDATIEVVADPNAPMITVSVIRPEHVTIVENQLSANDDDESAGFSIEQVGYRTVGVIRMDQDDHVETTDLKDAANKTRDSLPEGHCRAVYDILSQIGPTYDDYSKVFGDTLPKTNHIAEFLGITPRAVKQHKETISIHCLANDFVPASV